MRNGLQATPVFALLLGIVAVLGAVNWHMLHDAVDISPVAPKPGQAGAPLPSSVDLATPLDKKAAAQFGQVVERPLFNPSRKPVKREAAAASDPDTPPGDLRLIGVMKAGDQPPRALIRSANAQTGKWIAEGEEFDGWTLRKIRARSIVVESGGRSHELGLAMPRRTSEDAPREDAPSPEPGRKRR